MSSRPHSAATSAARGRVPYVFMGAVRALCHKIVGTAGEAARRSASNREGPRRIVIGAGRHKASGAGDSPGSSGAERGCPNRLGTTGHSHSHTVVDNALKFARAPGVDPLVEEHDHFELKSEIENTDFDFDRETLRAAFAGIRDELASDIADALAFATKGDRLAYARIVNRNDGR